MRHTPTLFAIPLSFFSRPLYREVMHDWRGCGFGYVYLALLVILLPVAYLYSERARSVTLQAPYNVQYMIRQVPVMALQHGELATNAQSPHFVHMATTGKVLVVIDTTTPPLQWQNSAQFGLVLGRTSGLLLLPHYQREFAYPADVSLGMTPEIAETIAGAAITHLWAVPWLAYPFTVTALAVILTLTLIPIALLAKGLLAVMGWDAGVFGLMRSFAVALTPMLALAALAITGLIAPPLWAFPLAAGAYFLYAVLANQEDDERYHYRPPGAPRIE